MNMKDKHANDRHKDYYDLLIRTTEGVVYKVSFESPEMADHWFKVCQSMYAEYTGHFIVEKSKDGAVIDSYEYDGSGVFDITPTPMPKVKKKPFVPMVFPDFVRPHYGIVVGKGTLSEKEIYNNKDKKDNKSSKNSTKKTGKETTKKTTKETTKKASKAATKKTSKETTNKTTKKTSKETTNKITKKTTKETTKKASKATTNVTTKKTTKKTPKKV